MAMRSTRHLVVAKPTGLFTATEAAGMGAGGAFILGLLRGRLTRRDIMQSLLETTRMTAAVFTVLIGALLFG